MNNAEKKEENLSGFAALRMQYEKLSEQSSGFKAQLGKRIGTPEDLYMIPAFYKLFPCIQPNEWHLRAAFIVPFLRYSDIGPTLGEYIGKQERLNNAGNFERRIIQIFRSAPHQDIIYLRQLLIRFDEPAINWVNSGLAQFFSIDEEKNLNGKKKLIKQYFIARECAGKGN